MHSKLTYVSYGSVVGSVLDTQYEIESMKTRIEQAESTRRRGTTLPGLLVGLLGVSGSLWGVVGLSESLVDGVATRETRDVLAHLHEALEQFHQDRGVWPIVDESTVSSEHDGFGHFRATSQCLYQLRFTPRSRRILDRIDGWDEADGYLTVRDGFGRSMLYVDPSVAEGAMSQWGSRFPRMSQHQAFFVSAGADRRFGSFKSSADDSNRRASQDNQYSFEAGRS